MIKCPKCKSDIEADSLFCDQCGEELRVCSKCKQPGRGKCCGFCGAPMVFAREAACGDAEGRFLVNQVLGLRLELVDGAIIGRREGAYAATFSGQSYVSGKHARLDVARETGGWSITDLGSTNGTFVNRRRLEANVPCCLQVGDRVKIATIEFLVE